MLTPGITTVTVRFLSSSGSPVAVDGIKADIYNSYGNLVESEYYGTYSPVPSPSPTTYGTISVDSDDQGTFYEITGLPFSDIDLFPGSFISVQWTPQDTTSPLPASPSNVWKLYWYVPYSNISADKTVVTWPAYQAADVLAYGVYRKRVIDDDYVFVGATSYPVFIDYLDPVSPSELAAEGTTYAAKVLVAPTSSPWTSPNVLTTISEPEVEHYRTDQSLCLVTGQVLNLSGAADISGQALFYIHSEDAPLWLSPTLYSSDRNPVAVPVNKDGGFAAPLVVGSLATCSIPDAGYFKQFVVPNKTHANILSLTTTDIEIRRGE